MKLDHIKSDKLTKNYKSVAELVSDIGEDAVLEVYARWAKQRMNQVLHQEAFKQFKMQMKQSA